MSVAGQQGAGGRADDTTVESSREPDAFGAAHHDPKGSSTALVELDDVTVLGTRRRLRSLLATAAIQTVGLLILVVWLVGATNAAGDDRRQAADRSDRLETELAASRTALRTAEDEVDDLENELRSATDISSDSAGAVDQLRRDLREERRRHDDAQETIAEQEIVIERRTEDAERSNRTLADIESRFPIELDALGAIHPSGDFVIAATMQSCSGWGRCDEPGHWPGRFDDIEVRCKNRCTLRGVHAGASDRLRFNAERGTWIVSSEFAATCGDDAVTATWRLELRPVTLGLHDGTVTVDRLIGDVKYAVRNTDCTDGDVTIALEATRS